MRERVCLCKCVCVCFASIEGLIQDTYTGWVMAAMMGLKLDYFDCSRC